jgi:hypothetical protein
MSDDNCVQVILYYGHRGKLVEDMARVCECDVAKASEFVDKYLHFLTKDLMRVLEANAVKAAALEAPLTAESEEIVPECESESK